MPTAKNHTYDFVAERIEEYRFFYNPMLKSLAIEHLQYFISNESSILLEFKLSKPIMFNF